MHIDGVYVSQLDKNTICWDVLMPNMGYIQIILLASNFFALKSLILAWERVVI